jgi:hypothetical protein
MPIQDTLSTPEINPEGVSPKVPAQHNVYKPSDIKRLGTSRFFAQAAPKEPQH